MINQFNEHIAGKGYPWKVEDLLPKVYLAGEHAGALTEAGAKLLDPSGELAAGFHSVHQKVMREQVWLRQTVCANGQEHLGGHVSLCDDRSGEGIVQRVSRD